MSQSSPGFRDFELPKLYQLSGLFVVLGLILLHWSQSMYFAAGNQARLLSLALGFGLIVTAALTRARWQVFRHVPMVAISGCYFLALAFLTKVQEHAIWYDSTQQIFTLVCLVLFWSGYILAQEKRHDFVSANQWVLVVVAIIGIIALLAFMRYVKAISFYGTERAFGETELNPVGVAFANSCLGLVFFALGVLSKSVWRKSLFLFAAALAFFVVLSSASRGAVLWSSGAIVFFFILNRHRKYLSLKGALVLAIGLIVITPLIVTFYQTNYGVAERIDVLFDRFEQMYYSLIGRGQDASITTRQFMWDSYLSNMGQWLLLGEKGYTGYPHNQWIEIGARFGLLGLPMLIGSIAIFSGLGVASFRGKIKHPDLEFSIIAILFVFGYLQSMTSLSLQVNRVLWLGFGYLLGAYLVHRKRRARG